MPISRTILSINIGKQIISPNNQNMAQDFFNMSHVYIESSVHCNQHVGESNFWVFSPILFHSQLTFVQKILLF